MLNNNTALKSIYIYINVVYPNHIILMVDCIEICIIDMCHKYILYNKTLRYIN